MRLPATRNRTLLCLNILLFALLVSTVLMLSGRLDFSRAAHSLPPKIAALGMEVYWEKGPFVLLTAKDFPRRVISASSARSAALHFRTRRRHPGCERRGSKIGQRVPG